MTHASEVHVLDRPVASSLDGHHLRFARRHGRAVRYETAVATFAALDDPEDPRAWDDAVHLLEPGIPFVVPGVTAWPENWELIRMLSGLQLEGGGIVDPEPDPEAVLLGPDDVPEILDLIARTDPGPFRQRTIELGTYLGIRREGVLVAMAGERMRPSGWTEISAVCTDPAHRGQGLAARLVRAVAAGILGRGETPFLHAAASNENAVRLYEKLGFTIRRTMPIALLTHASVG
ncbi:MAG TPA: GNAT family N-acetyltransferase [Actinospica sp.]|nr:GNAT family N-acetyltransferase [Actinospica sp.]